MSDLLNQASLVMVPSGYKEDTVYSVVPTDGSGDLSFTRASNGTRVNSAGLVEVAPWNLLEQSETFDNVVWSKEPGNTVTANTTTSPNGTTTADTLNATATNQLNIYQTYTPIAGSYTYSVYLKKNGTNLIETYIYQVGVGFIAFGEINFDNGTFTASLGTGSIENVGNGWYRVSLTASLVAGAHTFGFFTTSSTGTRSTFAWGAQLNIGSTAKPYFPTTDRLNVPRLTYQNGGGGCPSLLLEKQSTNLVTYSQQFTNPAWSYSGTIVDNVAISPDGTQNASEMSNSPYVFQGGSFGICTVSCYFKKTTANIVAIRMDTTSVNYIDFNIGTGVVGSVPSGFTASIESVGNGWYRCIVTANASVGLVLFLNPCYIWGAQVEQSSYPTSYIPTTSSSATRVADACYKTGISSLIGQTEGVVFVDFVVNGRTNNANILNSEKNTTCALFMALQTSGEFDAGLYVSGSLVGRILAGSISVGQRAKVAYAYKSGSFALYINGTQAGILSSTFTFPTTLDDIFLNDDVYFNYQEAVKYNQVALFKTRLTNAELASLTTI